MKFMNIDFDALSESSSSSSDFDEAILASAMQASAFAHAVVQSVDEMMEEEEHVKTVYEYYK